MTKNKIPNGLAKAVSDVLFIEPKSIKIKMNKDGSFRFKVKKLSHSSVDRLLAVDQSLTESNECSCPSCVLNPSINQFLDAYFKHEKVLIENPVRKPIEPHLKRQIKNIQKPTLLIMREARSGLVLTLTGLKEHFDEIHPIYHNLKYVQETDSISYKNLYGKPAIIRLPVECYKG